MPCATEVAKSAYTSIKMAFFLVRPNERSMAAGQSAAEKNVDAVVRYMCMLDASAANLLTF